VVDALSLLELLAQDVLQAAIFSAMKGTALSFAVGFALLERVGALARK